MNGKITLDNLTQDSVSVKTQQYATIEGIEHPVGQPLRKAYVNSTSGRASAASELPQAQQNAIMAVWGDTPTVIEDVAL
jgi:hypothetical protein